MLNHMKSMIVLISMEMYLHCKCFHNYSIYNNFVHVCMCVCVCVHLCVCVCVCV